MKNFHLEKNLFTICDNVYSENKYVTLKNVTLENIFYLKRTIQANSG